MLNEETGLLTVSVDEAAKMLSKSYINLLRRGIAFKKFPAVMLWGPPGVGKSQGVREIADIIENTCGKKVVITDVRLLLFNPVDLRGIPTSNQDKTLAVWLKPEIFHMDDNADVVNILFLDEISAAPPSVQASAYQIVLDRAVGEHKLPDNCIVIAAGNRVTDKSVAYTMPRALANRMCHIEIKGDYDSWHDWAVRTDIHEYVIGFLEYNSALLMKNMTDSNLAFTTPRSWEMVSNILKCSGCDIDECFSLISGCIGYNTAVSFKTWAELYKIIPSVKEIFEGKHIESPKEKELLIALLSSMVAYARKNPKKKPIDNSINYACELPWWFRNSLLHDYSNVKEILPVLKKNSIYLASVGDVSNDRT